MSDGKYSIDNAVDTPPPRQKSSGGRACWLAGLLAGWLAETKPSQRRVEFAIYTQSETVLIQKMCPEPFFVEVSWTLTKLFSKQNKFQRTCLHFSFRTATDRKKPC